MESDEKKFFQALRDVNSSNRRSIFSSVIGSNVAETNFNFEDKLVGNALHLFLFNLDKYGAIDFVSEIKNKNMSEVKKKRVETLYQKLLKSKNEFHEKPKDIILISQLLLNFFSDFMSKVLNIKELENDLVITTVINHNDEIARLKNEVETIKTNMNAIMTNYKDISAFPLYSELFRLTNTMNIFNEDKANYTNYVYLATKIKELNDSIMDIATIYFPQVEFHKPDIRSVIDGTMRMTGGTSKIPIYRQ